jgi:hypothetical protein
VDFGIKEELLFRYSAFIRYWRISGSIMGQCYIYVAHVGEIRNAIRILADVKLGLSQ